MIQNKIYKKSKSLQFKILSIALAILLVLMLTQTQAFAAIGSNIVQPMFENQDNTNVSETNFNVEHHGLDLEYAFDNNEAFEDEPEKKDKADQSNEQEKPEDYTEEEEQELACGTYDTFANDAPIAKLTVAGQTPIYIDNNDTLRKQIKEAGTSPVVIDVLTDGTHPRISLATCQNITINLHGHF